MILHFFGALLILSILSVLHSKFGMFKTFLIAIPFAVATYFLYPLRVVIGSLTLVASFVVVFGGVGFYFLYEYIKKSKEKRNG